jgi:hypothetical protein
MSWTLIGASPESWATAVTATGSWTAVTRDVVPPAWALLSSVTTSVDIGVDFRVLAREQYPMYVSTDRPVLVYDVYPEGTP